MSKTPEGLVKDMIKKRLDKRHVFYKMIVPHPYGKNVGISDFQLHFCGHFIVVEAKPRTGKKKPTVKQAEYMDEIDKAGSISFVVRNEEDMVRVEEYLDWAEQNPVSLPPWGTLRDDLSE
jgi:penicillin-binding protein-related factor A (putative recombinase)